MRGRVGWALAGSAVVATVLIAVLGAFFPELPQRAKEGPTLAWIAEYRVHLVVVLALVSGGGPLADRIVGAVTEARRKQAAVKRYLEHVHRRSWPGPKGGRHDRYRLSLFVPCAGNKLRCVYRTDRRPTKHMWSLDDGPDGHDADGLVAYVWKTQGTRSVAALPENPTPAERETYMAATFVTEDTFRPRTWKGAAMLGVPVQLAADGDPLGVLLVECRIPGVTIEMEELSFDAAVCGMILEAKL